MARAKPALERARGRTGPYRPWSSSSRWVLAVDHHHVLAHARVVVGETDRGIDDLARAGLVAKLGEDLGGLGDAGGAERMAAADEPAARIDDDVTAVVAAP